MIPLRKIDAISSGSPFAAGPARLPSAPAEPAPSSKPSSARGRLSSSIVHSALLSGVAGYVDTAGFVLLLGIFPAHLTGELIADALAFSSGHLASRSLRLWIVPEFVGSIVLAALVARLLRQRGRTALTGLLALVTLSLALFSGSEALAHLFHQGHLPTLLSAGFAVAAMGFQTALMRESLTGACPTTVMTGNLAHVVTELVEHLFTRTTGVTPRDLLPRSRLASMASALFAFVACAVLGGWLTRSYGSRSVLLPTLVTLALTVRAWCDDRAGLVADTANDDALPWFTDDDDVWPDSDAPRALSQPYTQVSSEVRIKVERVVLPDSAPAPPRRAQRD
jgi:uncharacterized membrane protein YoaK (UPF0700 family)